MPPLPWMPGAVGPFAPTLLATAWYSLHLLACTVLQDGCDPLYFSAASTFKCQCHGSCEAENDCLIPSSPTFNKRSNNVPTTFTAKTSNIVSVRFELVKK